MTRILALHVPLFPLAARLRSEPELTGEAVAVCEGNGGAARVAAASLPARRAGIRPGMTLSQARGILPDLIARGRDAGCERSAHEALLEAAAGVSPCVEETAADTVLADVDGMQRLYPGADGEAEIGHTAMRSARTLGLPVRAGVAATRLAARIAAERPASPTIVPTGEESAFLAPLPIRVLGLPPRLRQTLHRWGLTTVGDLARLPAADVARRLGADGEAAHRAARGEDVTPLVPRHPPAAPREGFELEWPVLTIEPLLLVAGELLGRLMVRLHRRSLACAALELELELEPEGRDRHTVRLPAPTTDVKALLGILRLELEVRPPGAPVAAVACIAHPEAPRRAQLTLFGPPEISPAGLATALARAAARLGPDRVGAPQVADSHLPERYGTASFAPPPSPKARRSPGRARGLLAVRVLRPPVPIEVITETRSEEKGVRRKDSSQIGTTPSPHLTSSPLLYPVSLRSADGARPHVQGLVRVAAGPWRCEEGWWSENPADRDYWDVEVSDGRLYRIFHDHRNEEWFADGVYD